MSSNQKQSLALKTLSNKVYRHCQKWPFSCFQRILVPIIDGVDTPCLKKFSRLSFALNLYSMGIFYENKVKKIFFFWNDLQDAESIADFGTFVKEVF